MLFYRVIHTADRRNHMQFKLMIRPRISETDLMGHINNVTPAIWMEEGRTYFFRECVGNRAELPSLMIRHVDIDYRDQMFIDYQVEISTGVARFGNTSMQLYQEIRQTGRLCVVGRSTLVFVDAVEYKPCAIPTHIRDALSPYSVDPSDG